MVDTGRGEILPKPFGSAPDYKGSLNWAHNFYSMVTVMPSRWVVKTPEGETLSFKPCTAPCRTELLENSADRMDSLELSGTTFTLHRDGAPRLVYADSLDISNTFRRVFLTRIEAFQKAAASQSPRVLAKLSYTKPDTCPEAKSAVPYIASVESFEGTQLKLSYKPVTTTFGSECVIDTVSVAAIGQPGRIQARFEYAAAGGNGLKAGELGQVRYGPNGMEGDEVYREIPRASACGPAFWTVSRNGVVVVKHGYEPPCGFLSFQRTIDYLQGDEKLVSNEGVWAKKDCKGPGCTQGYSLEWAEYTTPANANGLSRSFFRSFANAEEVNFMPGMAVRELTRDPSPSGQGLLPVTQKWDWTKLPGGPAVNTSYVNETGAGTFWKYSKGQTWEMSEMSRGSADGGTPLESTRYRYAYVGSATRKVVTETSQDSVLSAGGSAKTLTLHDTVSGRVKARIQSGFTKVFVGENFTVVPRFVGTFYFTKPVCSAGNEDEFGRTLEVHGPCLVDTENATDCRSGEVIPVTQYSYFPSSLNSADRNRLATVKHFSKATTANCAAASLTTTLSNYDAYGHALKVVDSNGIETLSTYEGNLLVRQQNSTRVTEFAYENAALKWVKLPEGNFEVSCHRISPLSSGCPASAPWSPQVQWRVKSADAEGKEWSEATVFEYWPEGKLKQETWFDETKTARRVIQHHLGDDGRPLQWTLGTDRNDTKAKSWLYNGAGDVIGVGDNANRASCGGVSQYGLLGEAACAKLEYDSAQRIQSMDDMFGAETPTGRSCMAYDRQGHLNSVRLGCDTKADCSTCTQPATVYQHDDFGNVVEVKSSAATAPTRMEYEARGNAVKRQTPSMVQYGEFQVFEFDGLGRKKTAAHTRVRPAAEAEALYSFTYDSVTLPFNCPLATNTAGRLAQQTDTFGRTFYSYSPWGEVLQEIRVRHGADSCTGNVYQNPSTRYEHDSNGIMTASVSPLGRRVEYGQAKYSTGAPTGKVETVSVLRFDGLASKMERVIEGMRWNAEGSVSRYTLKLPKATGVVAVDYVEGATPPDKQVGQACPLPKLVQPGSLDGFQRGLTVTQGPDNVLSGCML